MESQYGASIGGILNKSSVYKYTRAFLLYFCYSFNKKMVCLLIFGQLDTSQIISEEWTSIEEMFQQTGLWESIFLISDWCGEGSSVNCGWYHSWTGSLYKKANWASHGGQAERQQSAMPSASVLASRYLS